MTRLMPGFTTRRKVDLDLIERYEYEARYHGATNIKNELATAKRTATTLAKTSEQFRHLRPEQKLALDAAASAMRQLATDLTALTAWAKDYGAYCAAERVRADAAELEAFANNRWGTDPKALEFEADVIIELISQKTSDTFGHWMHSIGEHRDVKPEDFQAPFQNVYGTASHHDRKVLAKLIKGATDKAPHKWMGLHGMVYAYGWKDYERYLQHRKAAALTADKFLSGLHA